MQLDRTRIAIRERGTAELLDLALRVVMAYGPQLLLWTAVLAVPLALLNTWLTRWIVYEEYNSGTIFRYVVTMAELVFLEAALATLATTLCCVPKRSRTRTVPNRSVTGRDATPTRPASPERRTALVSTGRR